MAKKNSRPNCCLATCNVKSQSRGLCGNHYQSAQILVERGDATWEELEKHGLAKPPTRRIGLIASLLLAARGGGESKVQAVAAKPKAKKKKKPAKKSATVDAPAVAADSGPAVAA